MRKPPPTSSSDNLDFSVKTLEQIRAEKRKKEQFHKVGEDEDHGESAGSGIVKIAVASEDTEQTSRTAALVSRSRDRSIEEREEEGKESCSGKELPKLTAQKRKVVIKRSTLRKDADSASPSTTESARNAQQQITSSATSPERKQATEEISTSDSQNTEPCFDATCIDRSVPLPDDQDLPESKPTLLILEQLWMIVYYFV